MAKLEIRRRADSTLPGRLAAGRDYEFLVDGREIEHLTSVTLAWEPDGVPTAVIRFLVSDLEIDSAALVELQAIAARRGVGLPPEALEQIVGEVLARVRRAEAQ